MAKALLAIIASGFVVLTTLTGASSFALWMLLR